MSSPLSLASYIAIGINAASAFLLSNYLLSNSWLSLSLVVAVFTLAAYLQGHRYATSGKELPRKPYLLILALYTGLIALPPMARMRAAIFAYALARLLMFRAVWLADRREAYLHLVAYFAVVATTFGHWRADWSLLPLLLVYALTLMLALVLLDRDSVPDAQRANFPWVSTLATFVMAPVFSLVLLLVTPLPDGPNLRLIPDLPRIGNTGDPVTGSISKRLTNMMMQPARANTQEGGPFNAMTQDALQFMQKKAGQMEAVMTRAAGTVDQLLRAGLKNPWLQLALLLAIMLYASWRYRHAIMLWMQVNYLDIRMLKKLARTSPPDSPRRIYEAYERLWAYHGLARKLNETPLEHIHFIEKHYAFLGQPSHALTMLFQDWHYGQQSPRPAGETIAYYQRIRDILSGLRHERK